MDSTVIFTEKEKDYMLERLDEFETRTELETEIVEGFEPAFFVIAGYDNVEIKRSGFIYFLEEYVL